MSKATKVLNVCLVGPIPPPNGGMAMQTQQLSRLLKERGHKVKLVAVNPPYRPKFIERVPLIRAGFRLVPYFLTLFKEIKGADVVHIMANSGWSFHLFVKPAVAIASLKGVPIVINYRGGKARQFFDNSWKNLKNTFLKAKVVAVPSGFLKSVFSDFSVGTEVVPNIIDLGHFSYTEPNIDGKHLKIVITRNLEKIYDNETALEAFAIIHRRYPEAELTIAGTGPLEAELKEIAADLQLENKVHFVGRLGREEIAALYAGADIMLNPSTIDNMPNSILEALACGVVVVSTNVGGIPFMVENEVDALLVEPKNHKAMANAVIRLVEQADLALALAVKGNSKVTAYTPEHVIPLLESIYLKASQ